MAPNMSMEPRKERPADNAPQKSALQRAPRKERGTFGGTCGGTCGGTYGGISV